VVLDDLQWVDHSTLEAFDLLAFALADAHTAGEALRCCFGGLRRRCRNRVSAARAEA
jgi:hypothetical protein